MSFLRKLQIKDKGNFFIKNVFLLITLFLVIVIFAGMMISEKNISENEQKIKDRVGRECEYLSTASEEMINVVVTQIKNIIQFSELNYVFGNMPSDQQYYYVSAEICKKLKNISDLNSNIDSIYLYSKYRDEVHTDSGTILYNIFNDKSWLQEYLNSPKTEFKIYFRNNGKGKTMLTFLYHVKSGEYTDGCVVVNVDMLQYLSVMKKDGFSVITKSDTNEIIFMTKKEEGYEVAKDIVKYDEGVFKILGDYYGISKKKSQYSDFNYVYIQELEDYKSDVINIYIQIILISILLILLFAFIAFKISEVSYKPIKEIGEILENPYSYKSKKYLENDKNTKKIADKIFSVVYTNKMLYRELNDKMDNFNYAQLKALQWQVNPHFIFNTLNMLYLITEDIAGKGNKASLGILSLSKLIRYSLKTEPIMVPLSEELTLVNEYVKIMKTRLENSFDFEIITEERFKDREIIKMCIQPILENAFRYGIKNLEGECKIKIKISEENDCLKIEISDNGHGMSEEKLSEIRQRLKNPPQINEIHIGLLNVNSRMKLLYGENCGIKIESVDGSGTTVTLICPNKQ